MQYGQAQFAPSPYMAPQAPGMMAPPHQGLSPLQMGLIAAAVIVVAMYVLKLGPFAPSTAVTPGSLGGVTAPGAPSSQDKAGAPTTPTPVNVVTSPPLAAPMVTSITFTKDSTAGVASLSPGDDDPSFQIGEVKVYDSTGNLLKTSDFASAVYTKGGDAGYALSFAASNAIDGNPGTFSHTNTTPGLSIMTLTLAKPTNVSHVQVLNRQDCCQGRLLDVVCALLAADGTVIKSFHLSDAMTQDLVVSS